MYLDTEIVSKFTACLIMEEKKHTAKKIKNPWPTKDAMEQIYEMNLWGGNGAKFYSGMGSHHPQLVNSYVAAVTSFLQVFIPPLEVCDLGCGDFNIGRQLVPHTKKYIGVDIVEDLIKYNKEKFIADKLEFHCLDIATTTLPSGDCAILRQVLQHLSNADVLRVVHKLPQFKYVILTEHIPQGDFIPNKDILSGQGIRLKKQSGLNLLASPFNLKVLEETELTRVTSDEFEGIIVTSLYRLR